MSAVRIGQELGPINFPEAVLFHQHHYYSKSLHRQSSRPPNSFDQQQLPSLAPDLK